VSTRKVDRLVEQLGIASMSKDRVSAIGRTELDLLTLSILIPASSMCETAVCRQLVQPDRPDAFVLGDGARFVISLAGELPSAAGAVAPST